MSGGTYRDDAEATYSRLVALEHAAGRSEQLEDQVRQLERENRRLRQLVSSLGHAGDVSPPPNVPTIIPGQIYLDDKIEGYIAALLSGCGPSGDDALDRLDGQALRLAAMGVARNAGRAYVTPADVLAAAPDLLRARLAFADAATADATLARVLDQTEVP